LANTFAYVSPVIAVILGWAILQESITVLMIVAMAIILLGVALMVTTKSRSGVNKAKISQNKKQYLKDHKRSDEKIR